MTDHANLHDPWMGDVNEAVVKGWKAETTALERVTTVVDATVDSATASAIANRAAVAEPIGRRQQNTLAEVDG